MSATTEREALATEEGHPALELSVLPRLDPSGRPWKVSLLAVQDRRPIAADASLSAQGRWLLRGLEPGWYEIDIGNQEGVQWLGHVFEMNDEPRRLAVEVPVLRIAGRVRIGRRPLPARLTFVDDGCMARIPIESGDDGRFEGFISASGQARTEGWRVEIEAALPPVRHTLEGVPYAALGEDRPAWFDLTLATAVVGGMVLSEDGQARAGVSVRCESLERVWQFGLATADERGLFRFVDLPPGRYRVTAEGCEPQDIVVEGVDQELQFVARPPLRLRGQVVANGQPVSRAWVHFWRSPGVALNPELTGADGRFETRLPADLGEVGVTVRPPGYAFTMSRVALAGADALTISVEKARGRLVLDVADQESGGRVLLLSHSSSLEAIETLNGWANDNGAGRSGDDLIVPHVEPGEYTLCRATSLDAAALWNGDTPPEVCTTGVLAVGGTLVLSLPESFDR